MLSQRLLDALNADREENAEDMSEPPSTWYPNLVALIEQIKQREDTSFHTLHDFWGLNRPHGLHNLLGTQDANIPNDLQEESEG